MLQLQTNRDVGYHPAFPKRPENLDYIDPRRLLCHDSNATASASEVSSPETSLPGSSHASVHQQVSAAHFSTVIPTLKALLPRTALEDYSGAHSCSIPNVETLNSAYFKLLSFSAANNFAGLNGFSLEKVLEYMQVKTSMQFPQLAQSIPGPTSKALVEKLFRCAIEAGNSRVVEALLQNAGIDANEQVCVIEGER